MSSALDIASAFVEDAPPGEVPLTLPLLHITNILYIKSLTSDTDPALVQKLRPAFQRYNEAQFATAKLPGASQSALISEYNKLPDGRYFDAGSSTSWEFDHVTQKASNPQSYSLDSPHADLMKSLLTALSTYTTEHYPSSASTVCPSPSPSSSDTVHILLTATKLSPSNFWNGRFRSSYAISPSSSPPTLTGTISVSIHYYEDGNVRLETKKPISVPLQSSSASSIVQAIAKAERMYQEELNRALAQMNEESFKKLRRQLPVTRQKVEWEKVSGYRLGSDLRGGGAAPGK
ncbi:MAG: hypothetical protein Q9160_008595 [Pyrenula sp. 1 TL-2023]